MESGLGNGMGEERRVRVKHRSNVKASILIDAVRSVTRYITRWSYLDECHVPDELPVLVWLGIRA